MHPEGTTDGHGKARSTREPQRSGTPRLDEIRASQETRFLIPTTWSGSQAKASETNFMMAPGSLETWQEPQHRRQRSNQHSPYTRRTAGAMDALVLALTGEEPFPGDHDRYRKQHYNGGKIVWKLVAQVVQSAAVGQGHDDQQL